MYMSTAEKVQQLLNSEDLLGYEFDNSSTAMQTSVNEWGKFMRSVGVEPDDAKIYALLEEKRGSYHLEPHNDTIYNISGVHAALAGTKYEFMLRLQR